MEKTRTYRYRIEPRDVDFLLRATIASLTDHVLRAAGEDADANGFGIRNLTTENSTWVLLRIAIEIDRMPLRYDEIAIETWISEVGRLTTVRNFIIRNAAGDRIGAAVTHWAMINLSTRRPVDLSSHPDYAGFRTGIPCPIAEPQRLGACNAVEICDHKVSYSDVDFNRHANSVKYIEWFVDMLPVEYHSRRKAARFEINYIRESRLGDNLSLHLDDEGGISRFEVKDAAGAPVCRAAIWWT